MLQRYIFFLEWQHLILYNIQNIHNFPKKIHTTAPCKPLWTCNLAKQIAAKRKMVALLLTEQNLHIW